MLFYDHGAFEQFSPCHHWSNLLFDPCCIILQWKNICYFFLACCTEPYVIGHACAFQCRQTFVTIMFKYMQSIRRHFKKLVSHKILERTVSWSLFIKNRIAHYRTAPKIVFAIGFCLAKLWPCAWPPLLLLILNDFTLISY